MKPRELASTFQRANNIKVALQARLGNVNLVGVAAEKKRVYLHSGGDDEHVAHQRIYDVCIRVLFLHGR